MQKISKKESKKMQDDAKKEMSEVRDRLIKEACEELKFPPTNTAFEKLQKLQSELNECLIEREDQVEGALASLLAGVHALFLGPPGTGKSLLTNLICKSIDDAKYFEWLLTKFSTPEELFGPISMKGLKEDKYTRITDGKLPQAHIGFLDEVFKANSAILNSLLTLINERKYHNGSGTEDVPLLSCFGASNELPAGEELGALYDRFILRYWVEPINDDAAFCDLLDGSRGGDEPNTKLSLRDIKELQDEAEKVNLTREFVETVREIVHELKQKGVVASDRRWKAAMKTLKAFAYLRGLDEVSTDELEVLADILWDEPKDRKAILEVVAPRANPLNLKALEYLDAAKELYETWKASERNDKDSLQASAALKEIVTAIDADCVDRPATKTKKLVKSKESVKAYRKEIVSSFDI